MAANKFVKGGSQPDLRMREKQVSGYMGIQSKTKGGLQSGNVNRPKWKTDMMGGKGPAVTK